SHPSNQIERTYVATVIGKADEAVPEARAGVMLEDGPVTPRRVSVRKLGRDRWEFEVTITEGRKREVRRLCAALGLGVERLVRVKFGPIELGDLATGVTRKLTAREKAALIALTTGH